MYICNLEPILFTILMDAATTIAHNCIRYSIGRAGIIADRILLIVLCIKLLKMYL